MEHANIKKIEALRQIMRENHVDLYIVPTSDYHESEYVGDHFKIRKYLTGFTGSAGTLVVTMEEAGLWTDGRYFIQAAQQLEGGAVRLFKMGEEGVCTVQEYVKDKLKEGQCLGFDGRVINQKAGKEYEEIAAEKKAELKIDQDLAGQIWQDRPPLPAAPAYALPIEYCGESVASKLSRVREQMKKEGATVHILTSLYDIAWLLNVRGNDIDHVPVVLSFLMVTENGCCWYVNPQAVDEELACYLKVNQIQCKEYEAIYEDAASLAADEVVWLDSAVANMRLCGSLKA